NVRMIVIALVGTSYAYLFSAFCPCQRQKHLRSSQSSCFTSQLLAQGSHLGMPCQACGILRPIPATYSPIRVGMLHGPSHHGSPSQ
ncbi:hypothetical protein J3F83DRAFT_740351, partial [Trichoderma novae-zelandiae]